MSIGKISIRRALERHIKKDIVYYDLYVIIVVKTIKKRKWSRGELNR